MLQHIDDIMENIPEIKKEENYICHLCNSSFKSKAILKNHFKTRKDELHKQYRNKIELLEKTYNDIDTLDELKCLGCEQCKSCKSCNNNKNCNKLEFAIYKKNKIRLKKKDKEKSRQARELLEYFYTQIDQKPRSINVEIAILYNCLKTHSYECVKMTLDMRIENKQYQLKGLSSFQLQEGQLYLNIKSQIDQKDTIPFFIKQYYTNLNLHIPLLQFTRDYRFIQKIKDIYKLNDEQIKYVLQYAINKKIVPLAYIKNNIVQILSIYRVKEKKEKATDYLSSAIINLKQGKTTYVDIINIYGLQEVFMTSIMEALKENQYNQNFSSIEWLYNIKVPLTKDMYFLAKSNIKDKLYHFTDINDINNFKNWLKNYKLQFEN